MYDLIKAYHMVRSTDEERHVGRVMLIHNKTEPWKTFTFKRVAFGDIIAMLTLKVDKDLEAQKCATIDEQAASQLADSTYVESYMTL